MYKWNQDLYLVSRHFKGGTSIDTIMSKKEVQEFIKDNYDSSYCNLFIKKI